MLVISNGPRASRSSDIENARTITPWIVLHSVQLLLLIIITIVIQSNLSTVTLATEESVRYEEVEV